MQTLKRRFIVAHISRNILTLLLLLLIGSIFGSLIGQIFDSSVPWLNYGQSLGLKPTTLDLFVLSLTFGFSLKINVAGIIGFFLALLMYSRFTR